MLGFPQAASETPLEFDQQIVVPPQTLSLLFLRNRVQAFQTRNSSVQSKVASTPRATTAPINRHR
jgi:hypothetical protein